MSADVRVRMEVEGMRHQILHAFQERNSEMEVVVSQRLDKALDEWSLDRIIDDEIASAMQSEMKRVIGDVVREVMSGDLVYTTVRQALQGAVVEALKRQGVEAS